MSKLKVIKNVSDALDALSGTHLKGHLVGFSYWELVQFLGDPVFSDASADDKVQKEWVVKFEDQYFTIYDWKTYDVVYTEHHNQEWNIGGVTDAYNLLEYLDKKLVEQRNNNHLEQYYADSYLYSRI